MVHKLTIRLREYSSRNESLSSLTLTSKVDQGACIAEHLDKIKVWTIKFKLIGETTHSGLSNC